MVTKEIDPVLIQQAIWKTFKEDKIPEQLWELSTLPPLIIGYAKIRREYSLESLIRQIYQSDKTSVLVKQTLAKGTLLALKKWKRIEHGADVLNTLAGCVVETRADAAIPILRNFAEDDLIDHQQEEKTKNALVKVVATIGGFAPDPRVKEVMEKWIDDPRMESLAGIACNSLCTCAPDEYPRYLTRFLEVDKKHPGYFATDFILEEIARTVGHPRLKAHSDKLSFQDQTVLSNALNKKD